MSPRVGAAKARLRQSARESLQDLLNDVRRRVDEFDSFLIDAAEEYRDRFENDDDTPLLVEAVGPYYDGRAMDLGNILEEFRDHVLDAEGRIKKVKIRNVR